MVRGETHGGQSGSPRSRGRELRLLARIQLPSRMDTSRGPVSGAAMLAVLRAIDDHAHAPDRDQPLTIAAACDERGDIHPGIAERTGRSAKTVRRATAALEMLRLLDVEQHWDRHGRRRNRYLLDWSRIEEWVSAQACGDVDADAWIDSVSDVETADDQPTTTGHHDRSPRDMVSLRTTTPAHSSHLPPPTPTQRAPSDTDAECASWAAVAEAMSECGVSSVWPAIDDAQARGATADHLLAIVAHYRQHADRHGWTPAALQHRVRTAGPGVDVAHGWPSARGGTRGASTDDLTAAERRLREMPADQLAAFAAEALSSPNFRTVREFFQAEGLRNQTARETLARQLLKQEASR